jgi:hypothetical protein
MKNRKRRKIITGLYHVPHPENFIIGTTGCLTEKAAVGDIMSLLSHEQWVFNIFDFLVDS